MSMRIRKHFSGNTEELKVYSESNQKEVLKILREVSAMYKAIESKLFKKRSKQWLYLKKRKKFDMYAHAGNVITTIDRLLFKDEKKKRGMCTKWTLTMAKAGKSIMEDLFRGYFKMKGGYVVGDREYTSMYRDLLGYYDD